MFDFDNVSRLCYDVSMANNIKALTLDSKLTVRQAATITNMAVPTFYTAKRRKDFGLTSPNEGGTNHITVRQLVEHGLLDNDFRPMKHVKVSACNHADYDDIVLRNSDLEREIVLLKAELENIKIIADERAKHIDLMARMVGVINHT